jgi:hypothetical protein
MQSNDPLADLPVSGQQPAQQKSGCSPILVVILILVGICLAMTLVAVIVIVILAIMGPAIGNIFSNITVGL